MIEAKSRYISAMIGAISAAQARGKSLVVMPKPERVKEYNAEIQSRLRQTVFAHRGCNSWYKTKDGLITNNWPGTAVEYQKALSILDWDNYNISGLRVEAFPRTRQQHIGRVVEEPQPSNLGLISRLFIVALVVISTALAAPTMANWRTH